MAVPSFTMRQLLEAGVHFGHQTSRWNPKMNSYLFGVRSGVHIIDLQQTVPLLYRALEFVHEIASKGGRVLFVGTKRQASVPIAEAAGRCGQYYVNHRWLGGMLTNWKTISNSISRLKKLDDQLSEENLGLTKKELLNLTREREKLDRSLGGIREMGGLPDVVVVIDTNKEEIAVHEANKLNIPVIAIIDSNSNPQGIQYPIPGNDDATRAIITYCELIAQSILSGLQKELAESGVDLGSSLEAQEENIPELAQADDLVDTSVDLEGTAPVGEAKTEEVSNLEGTAPVGEAKTEEVPNLEVTEASGN